MIGLKNKKKQDEDINKDSGDDLLSFWDNEYKDDTSIKKSVAETFDDDDIERKEKSSIKINTKVIAIIIGIIAVVCTIAIAFRGVEFYKEKKASIEIEQDESNVQHGGIFESGEYTVGTDISSGKYDITVENEQDGMCEVLIRDKSGRLKDTVLIGSAAGKSSETVSLSYGDTLKITGTVEFN